MDLEYGSIEDNVKTLESSGWERFNKEDVFEKDSGRGYIMRRKFDLTGSKPKAVFDYQRIPIGTPIIDNTIVITILELLDCIDADDSNLKTIVKITKEDAVKGLVVIHDHDTDLIKRDLGLLVEYDFIKDIHLENDK